MYHGVFQDFFEIYQYKLRLNGYVKEKSILIWIGTEGKFLNKFSGLQFSVFSQYVIIKILNLILIGKSSNLSVNM